jgi:hypothetical protein
MEEFGGSGDKALTHFPRDDDRTVGFAALCSLIAVFPEMPWYDLGVEFPQAFRTQLPGKENLGPFPGRGKFLCGQPPEVLQPSEQTLHFPTSAISPQRSAVLRFFPL